MRILVVHGPGADPGRRGLRWPAPGDLDTLDAWCQQWAASLGAETVSARASDARTLAAAVAGAEADAVVLTPGEAAWDPQVVGAVESLDVPVVVVLLRDITRSGLDPADSALIAASARVLHGRGIDGYRDAIGHLVHGGGARVLRYGPLRDQVVDLRTPDRPGKSPLVVLLHGGFWLAAWERDLTEAVAGDLRAHGIATANVEYRRLGLGGGWPATLADVVDAVRALDGSPGAEGVDLRRFVLVGHSAGAQLALRAAPALRRRGPEPTGVVGVGPLADLATAGQLGGGALDRLLAACPDPGAALRDADPAAAPEIGVPVRLVHATDDTLVPVSQSRRFAAAATAVGQDVGVIEVAGEDHFAGLDPTSRTWSAARAQITDLLGR